MSKFKLCLDKSNSVIDLVPGWRHTFSDADIQMLRTNKAILAAATAYVVAQNATATAGRLFLVEMEVRTKRTEYVDYEEFFPGRIPETLAPAVKEIMEGDSVELEYYNNPATVTVKVHATDAQEAIRVATNSDLISYGTEIEVISVVPIKK